MKASTRDIRARRTQAERSEETRRRLIEAFVATIGEVGLARTTSLIVAKRAGVTRGAIQHHFPSRDELMAQIVIEITEHINVGPFHLDAKNMSLATRIDKIVDAYWAVYGSQRYVSALEIEATAKYDRALKALLNKRFHFSGPMRDGEWLALFHDVRITQEQSLSLRRVMVDTMRGLAMRKLLFEPRSVRAQLDTLKGVLLSGFEHRAALEKFCG